MNGKINVLYLFRERIARLHSKLTISKNNHFVLYIMDGLRKTATLVVFATIIDKIFPELPTTHLTGLLSLH